MRWLSAKNCLLSSMYNCSPQWIKISCTSQRNNGETETGYKTARDRGQENTSISQDNRWQKDGKLMKLRDRERHKKLTGQRWTIQMWTKMTQDKKLKKQHWRVVTYILQVEFWQNQFTWNKDWICWSYPLQGHGGLDMTKRLIYSDRQTLTLMPMENLESPMNQYAFG